MKRALFCLLCLALLVLQASAAPGRPAGYEPPRVHRTVEAQFPVALLNHPLVNDGEANVVILVDETGLITDSLVTRYTHPLFGKEAMETVHRWRFDPARLRGAPVGVRMEMVFVFARGQRVVNVVDAESVEAHLRHKIEGLHKSEVLRVCRPRDLDEPLVPVAVVQPMPPAQLGAQRRTGRVLVEFYVDAEGRPRMPVIVESDDDGFARSALEAVGQWRFNPPRSGGLPVLVLARQRFDFTDAASARSEAAPPGAGGRESPR